MARMLRWLGLATITFSMTSGLFGCVSQEKYNAKVAECDAALEQLQTANTTLATLQTENDSLKQQLASLGDASTTKDGITSNLNSSVTELTAENASLKAQLQDALSKMPQVTTITYGGGPLPAELSNALSDFAAANPGVVEYDAAKGIVKFKSDVTFPTGSSILTPEAKSVIDKFATILNSPAADGYELMVAGHTDNVPVTNPATIRAGNLNNWYLSCHRAISVAMELMKDGTAPDRIGTAGYGQERPIAENSTAAGRSANRRVEVLILPTKHSGRGLAVRTPEKAPAADFNKDAAVEAPTGQATPEFNK